MSCFSRGSRAAICTTSPSIAILSTTRLARASRHSRAGWSVSSKGPTSTNAQGVVSGIPIRINCTSEGSRIRFSTSVISEGRLRISSQTKRAFQSWNSFPGGMTAAMRTLVIGTRLPFELQACVRVSERLETFYAAQRWMKGWYVEIRLKCTRRITSLSTFYASKGLFSRFYINSRRFQSLYLHKCSEHFVGSSANAGFATCQKDA